MKSNCYCVKEELWFESTSFGLDLDRHWLNVKQLLAYANTVE